MNKFIDISEHNTITKYQSLSEQGLKGVIIKATEGTTYRDSKTEQHYKCLNGLIPLGFYHYLTVTSHPYTQAENFWNVIKDKEFQILPVLDVEQEGLDESAENFCILFMERFKELSGLKMIVYSGRCFIEERLSRSFRLNNVFWVADYNSIEIPVVENCKVIAHQYSESCMDYKGIEGKVDCSVLYEDNLFYATEEFEPNIAPVVISTINVLNLQKQLNIQCYTDKYWDELEEDGIAGELTLSACPTVRQGANGEITRWIQRRLNINPDGIFGVKTVQAVMNFQEINKLVATGEVNKDTWRKLLGMRG